ncbi:MAG: glycosyltransferase, partial [Pseudomonadota bacterium]
MFSVVIPTLNPGARLEACLAALAPAAIDGDVKEVIIADGGSTDATLSRADAAGARVVRAPRGRGP